MRAPLEHAAVTGDAELAKDLLAAGADGRAGWQGCDGRPMLATAAEGRNDQIDSDLLDEGSQPDEMIAFGILGRSALHETTIRGHADAARLI